MSAIVDGIDTTNIVVAADVVDTTDVADMIF